MGDEKKGVPISSYVIKIASRCNLNCLYCYEYNMGDDSWRAMPKSMSLSTLKKIIDRIKVHTKIHDFNNVSISLHGGEPLLVGHKSFEEYVSLIRQEFSGYRLSLGIQTNGIKIDDKYIEIFSKYNISVGLSLDGPPATNDKQRVYHSGRGSGSDVEKGLAKLQSSDQFGGILAVIHVDSDPIEVWRYLTKFNPPVLDFLLPHAHWDNSVSDIQFKRIEKHGDWLRAIFDDWYDGYRRDIRIRLFEEILYRLLGHPGSLESLGLEEVALITIGVNGNYEQVDTMKSVYPGAHEISLNVENNQVDEVFEHQNIIARQSGISSLSDKCKQCSIVNICGGGYYPHRYSSQNGFNNPSVYCSALMKLINHIKHRVSNDILRKYAT
jgi:uncharacterized protein